MSVTVNCACGKTYQLRDEFAGQEVKCPICGRVSVAGAAGAAVTATASSVFDRDLFLLRQKALTVNQKYFVSDENGQPLIFVERPAHLGRNLLALGGGLVAGFLSIVVLGLLAAVIGENAMREIILAIAPLVFIAVLLVTAMALSALRHVSFYEGASSAGKRVLEVLQDRKMQFPTVTYTVRTGDGLVLGKLSKNYLYNLFRKQWRLNGANGEPLCIVKEDSIILSLLRRVLGPFFGLLRTNFVFLRFGSEAELGEFKRKFTILDRYVLDLREDRGRTLDRRLAVATAVMLDTGERR